MARTLTLSDGDSGLDVSISFDRWDLDRPQWLYVISAGGEVLAEGTDMRGGSGDSPCEARAMETLFSFLGAYAEALEYEQRTGAKSDNSGLFPDSLRSAAETIGSDGFYLLGDSVRLGDE